MKKLALTLILSGVLLTSYPSNILLANAPATQSTIETTDYNNAYSKIFATMKKGMNEAPSTGNVNLDFVYEMTPHHEGGIKMAKAIIEYGSNPEVKKIAEHIVTSQEAQLPIMKQMQQAFQKEELSNKEDASAYVKRYTEIKDKMFKEMESVPLGQNADVTFLKQMIFHHEGAIAMAKDILQYTKNPELIKLAKNISKTQAKGVKEMQKLLKALE